MNPSFSGDSLSTDCPLAPAFSGIVVGAPSIQSLEHGEASPSPVDLTQPAGMDSASSVPLLSNKLAARVQSIDGPVTLHSATPLGILLPTTISPLGDFGKASRPLTTGTQPLLMARRIGSGKGGLTPHPK